MRTTPRTIGDLGYRFGLAAALATVAFDIVQTLQIVGAFRFPLDEVLIYGTSLCIVVPLILEMLALHHLTTGDRRFWTHAALIFTIIYGVFVTANYAVQLATVIPARLAGGAEAVRVLEQTPHSMFWTYDAIGYISLGLATLVAIPAIGRTGRERRVRRALMAHALVTPLISIVYFAPGFSQTLLLLGLPWAVTAPLFMATLAIMLRSRQLAAIPQTAERRDWSIS
jgi:hypothetical protein